MTRVITLTETNTLELIGQTIVNAEVVGNDLFFTTSAGVRIPGGKVRGGMAANPTALDTSFVPAGTIAAKNVQDAIAELGNDVIALNKNKVNVTNLPKIRRGVITITDRTTSATREAEGDFSDIFPDKYFTKTPNVVISPILPIWPDSNEPNPTNLTTTFTVHSITVRGFETRSMINALPPNGSLRFYYIAVQPVLDLG